MDYIIVGLCVVALGLLALALILQNHSYNRSLNRLLDLIGVQQAQAQEERRELVNRAQFPDRMPVKRPVTTGVTSNLSDETRKALNTVGTVAPQVASNGD